MIVVWCSVQRYSRPCTVQRSEGRIRVLWRYPADIRMRSRLDSVHVVVFVEIRIQSIEDQPVMVIQQNHSFSPSPFEMDG